jgi:hypothetical protein
MLACHDRLLISPFSRFQKAMHRFDIPFYDLAWISSTNLKSLLVRISAQVERQDHAHATLSPIECVKQ